MNTEVCGDASQSQPQSVETLEYKFSLIYWKSAVTEHHRTRNATKSNAGTLQQ